jgi:hypothetical protein
VIFLRPFMSRLNSSINPDFLLPPSSKIFFLQSVVSYLQCQNYFVIICIIATPGF